MAEVITPTIPLTSFHACDRCGPYTRSAEMWAAKKGDLLLSFCQSHADRYAVAMWNQGFRPIMKAPA